MSVSPDSPVTFQVSPEFVQGHELNAGFVKMDGREVPGILLSFLCESLVAPDELVSSPKYLVTLEGARMLATKMLECVREVEEEHERRRSRT